jgi:TetR/AcrR family transcriptional regulator
MNRQIRPKTMTGNEDAEGRVRARNERLILDTAVSLFSTKGFDGTTISEIAETAGLPKANVYYYFSTKAAIYERLIGEVLKDWDQALRQLDPELSPREALFNYVTDKLEFSRLHGEKSRFFAGELLRGGTFLTPRQKRHVQSITHDACAVVQGWIDEGRCNPVDPRHLFIMLWSTTQFYADFAPMAATTLEVPKLRKADFTEAAKQIIAMLGLWRE